MLDRNSCLIPFRICGNTTKMLQNLKTFVSIQEMLMSAVVRSKPLARYVSKKLVTKHRDSVRNVTADNDSRRIPSWKVCEKLTALRMNDWTLHKSKREILVQMLDKKNFSSDQSTTGLRCRIPLSCGVLTSLPLQHLDRWACTPKLSYGRGWVE